MAAVSLLGSVSGDDAASLAVLFENDLFFGTDQHYTNGVRLELTLAEDNFLLPGVRPAFYRDFDDVSTTLLLGQNLYTPNDISVPDLIPDDRPYAAWLYGGVRYAATGPPKDWDWGISDENRVLHYSSVELNVGVIGPSAQGESIQDGIHDLTGSTPPRGWDHQLRDEIAIDLNWFRSASLRLWEWEGLSLDVEPFSNVRVGTVYVQGGIGIGAALGINHFLGSTPRRLAYSSRMATRGTGASPWSFVVFGSYEARGVAWNTFLDGNLFTDSHSVDKEHFVWHAEAGLGIRFKALSLSYIHVMRSEEFENQDTVQRYGSVRLGFQCDF